MKTMFKLFEKPVSTTEMIEEIHESFFTEVDKLLAEAKISHSLVTDKQELIDKCHRLKSLGFTSTKEVKEAEIEIERLSDLQRENRIKRELIEAIDLFSIQYPTYKFITEESVIKICEKYGLVYGEVSRYLGTVPDKNLKHIEKFKVLEEHECYVNELSMFGYRAIEPSVIRRKYITKREYDQREPRKNISDFHAWETNQKCPLEIAAPASDFDLKNTEIVNHKIRKIEIPDPVVLKPVIYKSKKYYLIVTAWGIEASDEMVVNQQNN